MPDPASPIDRAELRLARHLPHARFTATTGVPLVTFTFDDVPDTALTHGARILEERGLRGTFYIAAGLAGRVEANRTLIDEAGVRALAEAGHEIGCHTFAHARVRTLGPAALAADLDRNAAGLEALAPAPGRRNFAFPYNAPSFRARTELARRFRSCRGGVERIVRGPVDRHFLPAVEIRQPESHVAGLTRWIDDVAANPGWLIFFTHDVGPEPTLFGATPDSFARLVDHALEKGCTVLPLGAALDRLGAPGG